MKDMKLNVGAGVNQSGLRDFNERLLLTMIQKLGPRPGSELARQANLSAQTVSVILRGLEQEGLVRKGEPMRGRVGKPSVPIALNPDGAYSFGLKIGRRSSEVALVDLMGNIRAQERLKYPYPLPDRIFGFLKDCIAQMTADMAPAQIDRIGGIGVATPFQIWEWRESLDAPAKEFEAWIDLDFATEIERFSHLPVHVVNDATAACHAENAVGAGRDLSDFVHFFVGTFIGGGIVLNRAVYEGSFGNAGALGSIPSMGADGESRQLLHTASLFLLEKEIAAKGADPRALYRDLNDWSEHAAEVDAWVDRAGAEIAAAVLSACAIIDFPHVVIDGAFPRTVRAALVDRVEAELAKLDSRGLIVPKVHAGKVGPNARVKGAAFGPLQAQHFLQQSPFSPALQDATA